MESFSQLYQTLDQTTSTNAKVQAMVDYFGDASDSDAAWAVYFLSGRRLKRLIGAATLRRWLAECSDLPEWLVEDCYTNVGDLAETIALLTDSFASSHTDTAESSALKPVNGNRLPSLTEQVAELQALAKLDEDEQKTRITGWWHTVGYGPCFLLNKLLTGGLRVGVSQLLLARAVAQHADLPRAVILHRLMGEWTPDQAFWQMLISADDGQSVVSRPYPFCLASPLEDEPESLGDIDQWIAEWKWDGIRAQLIRREAQTYLWSRGEELITDRFPEIKALAEQLPDGTVLDGEILPWNANGVMPFSELQRRIGRKTVGKKLLAEVPCIYLAYDCMEASGDDIREMPLSQRRQILEQIVESFVEKVNASVSSCSVAETGNTKTSDSASDKQQCSHSLQLSSILSARDWHALAEVRKLSREKMVEGLMLKHVDAPFYTGRKRGQYWKWKIEPYTVDAVMVYAQAGHGRRSNLFTDYTFAVWDNDTLVPIAKAYSGLDNDEINTLDKWIRKHTVERFGPVRSVVAEQVFELAFEGINASTRHKSGIAVRFPRIARWRQDLSARDADTLTDIKKLISSDSSGESDGPARDTTTDTSKTNVASAVPPTQQELLPANTESDSQSGQGNKLNSGQAKAEQKQ
jgi:DNA ligase-1